MIQRIKTYVKKHHMIERGDHVIVALSGGADSVCLLLVMKELAGLCGLTLGAAHVEHGIRGEESLRDASFCKELCEKHQIPLRIFQVDAPGYAKERGMSLEEAARELRYGCLREAAGERHVIAVAHNMEDNMETMLFHLSRGSGLNGTRGIPPARDSVIRPLLCVGREEIEGYLKKEGASYCTDATNFETAYTRNRVRHHILPELKKINPRAAEHFFRLSEEAAETAEYLDEQVRAAAGSVILSREKRSRKSAGDTEDVWEAKLDKRMFHELHPVIGNRLLYQILGEAAGARKDITRQHVEALRELCEGKTGRKLSLPFGITAGSSYDRIYICRGKAEENTGKAVSSGRAQTGVFLSERAPGQNICLGDWIFRYEVEDFDGDMTKICEKTYTKWFDYDMIKNNVLLRYRMPGDFLQVNAAGGIKKLKDYFINEKIPRSRRERLPLIADGSHILWAVGYRISEAYKVTARTTRILKIRAESKTGENKDGRNHS